MKGEISIPALAEVIDSQEIQALMEDFYELAHIPMSIIDLEGKVLVGVGWQEICVKFHRIHPETCKNCIESDTKLSAGVPQGKFRLYKCKNNMWDISTPVLVGGKHAGNLFSGQFFFEDEPLDRESFRLQAERYGFDEREYLAALGAVPRLSRERVNKGMAFLLKLSSMISRLGYSNIQLAGTLTERDRLMDTLCRSEERLRVALEAAKAGTWEWDLQTDENFWSEEIWRLYGLKPHSCDPCYDSWRRTVHPDDRAKVEQTVKEAVGKGAEVYTEWRVFDPDGQERWLMSRGRPAPGAAGETRRYTGIVLDITQRKRGEEDLRKSREDLNRAQAVSRTGSWRLDVRRNELLWSDETHHIFGLPGGTGLTYERFLAAVHPEDRSGVDAAWQAALRGEPYDIEHRIVVGEEIKWVRERAELEFDKEGFLLGGFGTVQDITQRRETEDVLYQQTQQLKQLNETLELRVRQRTAELAGANEDLRDLSSKLLSAQEDERKKIACDLHDSIGSCLVGIKYKVENIVQQLHRTESDEAESLAQVLPVIQEGIEECRRLQMDLRPSMLDDLGLFATLSWFFRGFQSIYSMKVEQEIEVSEEEIPRELTIVIYRIVQEAMTNIAKHSQANQVRLSFRKVDGRIELSIHDNGSGFDLKKMLSLRKVKRCLGLVSMRERAELSKGSFFIETVKGKGTIIRATWPLNTPTKEEL